MNWDDHSKDRQWAAGESGSFTIARSVTYGNGKFVAVGSEGVQAISSDGEVWSLSRKHGDTTLFGINYGNDMFVTVGSQGTIMTSNDGENWTKQISGATTNLYGISFINGKFIVVGEYGTILTSSDGVDWKKSTSGTTNALRGITYGKGSYVAVGDSGTILNSIDSMNWVNYSLNYSIGANEFIDGGALNGVTYSDGVFVAVGNNHDSFSSDGMKWKDIRWHNDYNNTFSIASNNGIFVASGEHKNVLHGSNGSLVADLSGITLSSGGISPTFDAGTTNYTVTVDYSVSSITVNPTLTDDNANVTVDGLVVKSGAVSGTIELNVGSNTIEVAVMAQDGSTIKAYTVTVTRTEQVNDAEEVKGNASMVLYINGEIKESPTIVNDHAMVPLRMVSEALGAQVDWDADTKTITVQRANTTIGVVIDNDVAIVNGAEALLPERPFINESGMSLVPLRFIFEALEAKVEYNEDTRTIHVTQ